jgi:hypothetical protein
MKCEATARIPPRPFLAGTDVFERRGRTHPNAIDDIVANLVVNYELSGRLTLRVITEEATTKAVRDILAVGPTYHRKWCTTVFSDTMAGLPRTQRDRRLSQLVAFCDLHNLGSPEDQLWTRPSRDRAGAIR